MEKNDYSDKLRQLTGKLKKFRDDREWGQFHTPKNLAIDISIESAELLAEFEWQEFDKNNIDKLHLARIEDEVGDVLNSLILFADTLDIDLIEVADKKVDKTALKYPIEKSKGRAVKYKYL